MRLLHLSRWEVMMVWVKVEVCIDYREWGSGPGGVAWVDWGGGPWLKWEPQRRARFGEGKKLSLGCIALHLIGLWDVHMVMSKKCFCSGVWSPGKRSGLRSEFRSCDLEGVREDISGNNVASCGGLCFPKMPHPTCPHEFLRMWLWHFSYQEVKFCVPSH